MLQEVQYMIQIATVMAGIDKTYVNKEQLLEAIEWAKGVGKATLEDGSTFYPINIYRNKRYILWKIK